METRDTLAILQKNLSIASDRLALAEEQKQLCASMLANELCLGEGALDDLFFRFCSLANHPRETEKALFFRAYAAKNQKDRALSLEELFSLNELPPAGSHGKIALVRNRHNETAYEHFSTLVIGARPSFVSDFSEACDLVYNGAVSYCILPVESSTSGRLTSFYAMLDRYELKICATMEIENEDTSESVRYALAGRSLPRPIPKAKSCTLEFSLTREDGAHLADILSAISLLGAKPLRMDFLPLEYDHSFYRIFLSLRVAAKDAPALGLYLSICHPNYTPIGFYAVSYRKDHYGTHHLYSQIGLLAQDRA